MKVISFEIEGKSSYGLVTDDGITDAGAELSPEFEDLRALLEADALERLREFESRPTDFALDAVRYLPVVPNARKILCVGINYMGHIKETGREPPDYPVLFTRFSDSFTGHDEALIRPSVSKDFDYEGELAIIMGRTARHVTRDQALDYVAGYTVCNEGSVRDYQFHTIQFTAGKNFYRSGSLGPWMVTAGPDVDPTTFHLQTRINGTVLQDSPVDDLCFDIGQLVEYCSIWTPLNPGDIVVTGTPGGVGRVRKPPVWMKPGDIVEVDISGVGVLRNTIADEETA
jgi:2-keto-4-pentenoate hydratase/2-oxohepta-3-ene-1,7-dioic acid hydratase in catechol pathway